MERSVRTFILWNWLISQGDFYFVRCVSVIVPKNSSCNLLEATDAEQFDLLDVNKGAFTHIVFQTVFVGGTFDLINVMCKQHHRNALNPFLNGLNKRLKNAKCKHSLKNTKSVVFHLNTQINCLAIDLAVQFSSATWPAIWLQSTSFTWPRCKTFS